MKKLIILLILFFISTAALSQQKSKAPLYKNAIYGSNNLITYILQDTIKHKDTVNIQKSKSDSLITKGESISKRLDKNIDILQRQNMKMDSIMMAKPKKK
jgi:parvulin-like peptidyl-prolyl isomerase